MDPWGRLGRLEWLSDSRTVLVKTYPRGVSAAAYLSLLKAGSSQGRAPADPDVTVRLFHFDPTDRDSIPSTDPTNLSTLLGELALIDVETGAMQRISGAAQICSFGLSPNRRMLAWATATRFQRPGSHQILVDLFVHDLVTGRTSRLVSDAPLAHAYPNFPLFSWSPTNQAIAYRTDGVGIRDEVFVAPVHGGAPRLIAQGPVLGEPHQDERALWDSNGQWILFARHGSLWRAAALGTGAAQFAEASGRQLRLIEQGTGELWSPDDGRSTVVFTKNPATKRSGLARVDLTSGAVTQLFEEDKWYSVDLGKAPVVTLDRKAVVFVAEDPRHPPNFWLVQGETPVMPRAVSRVGNEFTKYGAGMGKLIEWHGLDGDSLRGALIYPAGYRPNTRYPMIVKVYGGTDVSDDLHRFGFGSAAVENLQVFASRGYALLLADSKAGVGTPMVDLLKSVMPGIDRAIELGVADPARIGIMGHSYGGYSVLALIVQSRRFKAAVVRAGIGDLISAYGQLSPDGTNYLLPWAERGQGRMGGTPWEVRERYIENSPVFYLDRVETPVLIVQGETDAAPFLADQVFSALRRLRKRVEYARYAGEGHSEALWKRPNQIDYLRRVVQWFDRYLKQ
jgi:dipeptidyl aminopeptidase/acylaminoacyl peptidase